MLKMKSGFLVEYKDLHHCSMQITLLKGLKKEYSEDAHYVRNTGDKD